QGADVNYVKSEGVKNKENLLITAVINKNVDIARILLEYKADINWKDSTKSSAILYAAKSNKEMFKLISDYGGDLNEVDTQGNNVLTNAKLTNDQELIIVVEEKLKEKA